MDDNLDFCTLAASRTDEVCGCAEEEYWCPLGFMVLHVAADGAVLDARLELEDNEIDLSGLWPTRAAAYQALETAVLELRADERYGWQK